MSVYPTWTLEAELHGPGYGWTDLGDDVVMDPMVLTYGITGNDPTDRTAGAGSIKFALDNSADNALGALGAYSLAHANKRAGFEFDIAIRLKLQYGAYTRYKFLGKLSYIKPVPGTEGPLVTRCEALDWMDDAGQMDLPDLDAQENLRADQLLTLICDALPALKQPAARAFETGTDSYAIALDGGAIGAKVKIREVLDQIARSEAGRIYLRGDDTQGGVLTFEPRQSAVVGATEYTFSDDVIIELDNGDDRNDVVGRIKVTAYPVRTDASPTTVLFSLETTQTLVRAGQTNTDLFGPYRDPAAASGAFIGAVAGGFGSPIVSPHTDYEMNSASDGSGTDLTANFTVTASATGRGVRWTITNNGAVDGYITKLQLRGRGVYRSEVIVDREVGTGVGKTLEITMPFQNSVNVAQSVANFIGTILSEVNSRVRRIRFLATESDALLTQALLREPGDRIGVRETVSGVDGVFVINRVTLEFGADQEIWCTYDVAPTVSAGVYWRLGVPGFSELGVTTRLAA